MPELDDLGGSLSAALLPPLRTDLPEGDDDETLARLCWSCIVEPGDSDAGMLIATLGAGCVFDLLAGRHDQVVRAAVERAEADDRDRSWHEALERWQPRLNVEHIVALAHAGRAMGASFIVPQDDVWPRPLDDLGRHAPVGLWVRGDMAALPRRAEALAIVGSRSSSAYGDGVAGAIAASAADARLTVVSGGAYGIDAAAHRVAVASHAPTIAVLAGGVDRLYPVGHTELFRAILTGGGALVAELPCGQSPTKWRFLQRNRLIAAMTAATVVVEAGVRSGALNTAHHALELGRELGAVPGPITASTSVGCHRLLQHGSATLIGSGEDAIRLWQNSAWAARAARAKNQDGTGSQPPQRDDPALAAPPTLFPASDSAEALRVFDAVPLRGAVSDAVIAEDAGLALAQVRAALGLLELDGRVERTPTGWRRCRPR